MNFYPQSADSIGPSVHRSVGPSVSPQILAFFRNPVSQLWDLIKTWGFREDLKLIVLHHEDDDNNDDDDDNDEEDDDDKEDNNNNNNNIFKFKFISFGT